MTPPPTEPRKQPTSAGTPILKFSKKRLALAFAIAGISDAIGAFAAPLPPIVWVVFALLRFGAILFCFRPHESSPRPSGRLRTSGAQHPFRRHDQTKKKKP